jgi:hypothetical protein
MVIDTRGYQFKRMRIIKRRSNQKHPTICAVCNRPNAIRKVDHKTGEIFYEHHNGSLCLVGRLPERSILDILDYEFSRGHERKVTKE